MAALPAPSACFWCDLPERSHDRDYYGPTGEHRYTQPTNRLIKQRMLARRAARTTTTTTTGGTHAER
jgi:hypothetical protein